MGVAFTAGAGVQVVGRCDAHRRRRLFVRGAPPEHFEPWDGTALPSWLLTTHGQQPTCYMGHLTVTKPYIGGCVSLPRKWPLMPQITRYVPGCRNLTTS